MAVSVATAMLLGAVFAGDSVWTAIAVLAVAGGWGALALAGRAPLPGGGTVLLGLVLAIGAWSGLSVAWSVAPDLSWAEVNRTLVLAGFLSVGLLLGACGADRVPLGGRGARDGARRRRSLGARGQGDPCALPGRRSRRAASRSDRLLERARARRRHAPRSRSAAGGGRTTVDGRCERWVSCSGTPRSSRCSSPPHGPESQRRCWESPCGSGSRRDRVEAALLALVAVVPGGLVAAWAFTRPALVDDALPRADRVADGAWFGLLLVAGGALAAFGAVSLRPLEPKRRAQFGRVLGGLAVAGVAVAAIAVLLNAGRIADEFGGAEVSERSDAVHESELEQPLRLVG